MKNVVSFILLAGILLLANLLSRQFFFRADLTENKQYSLSQSSMDILGELEDPVLVKAYFTEGVKVVDDVREDYQDLLTEFSVRSKGMVDFEFINPSESDELGQEAQQNGIGPIMVTERKEDKASQQMAYLGVVVEAGEQKDVIPVVQPGSAMEYDLITTIKKISVLDKPSIGFVQGYGTPNQEQLAPIIQQLSILYTVENVDLNGEVPSPDRFRAIALIAPTDSIPGDHLAKLNSFVEAGGGLFLGINAVSGDLQQQQGAKSFTGIEGWLGEHGVVVDPSFLVDQRSGSITVQQQQGFFRTNTQMAFYYFPNIIDFAEHPITTGLESVILPFASPLSFTGESSSGYTPILFTSNTSGSVQAPIQMKIDQSQWSAADFPTGELHAGAVLTKENGGRIVVIGDGDFAMAGGGRQSDNMSLLINSLDWLADDTGLIDLRTKAVASRPLEDIEPGKKQLYKMGNFFIPIALVVLYGLFRSNRRKSLRNKRMQEDYAK